MYQNPLSNETTSERVKGARSPHLEALQHRANVLRTIRDFFWERGVLEVNTSLLGQSTASDLHLDSFQVNDARRGGPVAYLQTSPEYAMKRLLCAGSGPIYQLCPAFRAEDRGRYHHPEFTMLEWYRPQFDPFQLMDEIDALLSAIHAYPKAARISYGRVFKQHLSLDPHLATDQQLIHCVRAHVSLTESVQAELTNWERSGLLDCLFGNCIQPKLGFDRPVFVYDYPSNQAALAILRTLPDAGYAVAERFELFIAGVELANAYHELTDPAAYRARFQADNQLRKRHNKPSIPVDQALLEALQTGGLPPCSGVALGVDRLVMLVGGYHQLADVLFLGETFALSDALR